MQSRSNSNSGVLQADRFNTGTLLPRRQADYWQDLVRSLHFNHSFVPRTREIYVADMDRYATDDLQLVRYSCAPGDYARNKTDARRDGVDVFELLTPLSGEAITEHGRSLTKCVPGTFTLFDASLPFRVRYTGEFSGILFKIPREQLARRLPDTQNACGIALPVSTGLSAMMVDYCNSFAQRCRTMTWLDFTRASTTLIDLVAFSVDGLVDLQSAETFTRAAILRRLKRYIEENVSNSGLSTPLLARHFRISERYIQALFNEAGTTVRDYIRNARLDLSYRRLEANLGYQTVTEIAFDCGFSDSAYFSTAFRKKFGHSPKDVRRRV